MRFHTHNAISTFARVGLVTLLVGAAACGNKDRAGNDSANATAGVSNGAVATATPTGLSVTEVVLGRNLASDKSVSDQTTQFKPSDTIYASVRSAGTANNTTIKARWLFQDGQVVNEESRTIGPNDAAMTEFHIVKPSGFPKGNYKVEILVNGTPASTKEFTVK